VSAIVFAMPEKTKKTNKGEKNMNKKIKMNGITLVELDFKKVKYKLVKVIIPKNDSYFVILTEYNDNGNDIFMVKACGLYPEDAFTMAVKKADYMGNTEEIEKLHMLLGKFALDRWNGKLQS